MPATRSITQTVAVPASPSDVYDALVTAKLHAAFTQSAATGVARVGAKFTAWDGYIEAKNVALTKGKRIVQAWRTSEWPAGYPPSKLEIRLTKRGAGTSLTMVHSDVPASQAAGYRQGWTEYYWQPLKAYFGAR